MQKAEIPTDEPLRLAALRRTGILDTAPDPAFDRITALAARIFETPIALVSLVDEARQWFKSHHGLNACETGRDEAFCAHAILQDEPLVVLDATRDPRFADNPLVTGPPHLAFYAGAQLTDRNGFKLGTLCVIDNVPRESFDAAQCDSLKALAAAVITELELRKALRGLESHATDLERANQSLRAFTDIAAHDLREPVRMITGFTDLLRKRYSDQLDEDGRKYVDIAHNGGLRLYGILDDLLAFSRANAAEIGLNIIDTTEVLEEVRERIQASLASSNATLEVGELPPVRANAGCLATVLQNLVGNALKYRSEETPHVSITAEPDGAFVRFCVEDNGMGIDAAQHERVFEMFRRLHSRDSIPGTGLGLAICRTVVERHGGRIWLESEPGRGSTFYFTVPAA